MNSRLLVSVYKALPRKLTSAVVRILKPTYPIGVVAVVFDSDERLLLLHHTYHSPVWRLPGGLMERGENPEAVVLREVMEEANCRIESLAIVDAVHEAHTFDVAVLARLVDESSFVPNAEVCDRRWVHIDELPQLPASQMRFIHRARAIMRLQESG